MTAVAHTRRKLILASSGSAAVAAAGIWRSARAALPEPTPLKQIPFPPLIDARSKANAIALHAQAGQTEFFPGKRSQTLGYNGNYLGPTLRFHRGDDVQVTVSNELKDDTTVHWHGLLVPGHLDGGPHQNIAPGAQWRPVLAVRQQAATLIYHTHAHGRTAEGVYLGLAGVLIVTDEEEQRLKLPSEYGVDDLPLVIQDRLFDKNGLLLMPSGMPALMHGRRGNTLLVNGTPRPKARVPAGLVRLRLVNASNARTYQLAFDDARPLHWIASEAGLLEAPESLKSLWLAPGQRAEILVDFSDARPVRLVTGPDPNVPMMMNGMRPFASDQEPVIAFEPSGPPRPAAALPAQLVRLPPVDPARSTRRRRFTLDMGMGAMMGRMMGGGMSGMMGRGMGGGGMRGAGSLDGASLFAINGRSFDMARVDERVRVGDTEIWEFSGQMMAHPLHIHGVHFRVISRGGKAPDVLDQGLRDTVMVGEPVELLVQFTQAAGKTPFMYHCHILEHEDNGMMGQFSST